MARIRLLGILLAFLCGCVRVPDGIEVVADVDFDRYLGTWYEIVRLDHPFERGLDRVTATYAQRSDGGIRVLNRGYDSSKRIWREAEGKAYPIGATGNGTLKVSFFGPFYSSYNIIALDKEQYQYAMICGPSRDYFWILSRTPTLASRWQEKLLSQAAAQGFAVDKLIFVNQEIP